MLTVQVVVVGVMRVKPVFVHPAAMTDSVPETAVAVLVMPVNRDTDNVIRMEAAGDPGAPSVPPIAPALARLQDHATVVVEHAVIN